MNPDGDQQRAAGDVSIAQQCNVIGDMLITHKSRAHTSVHDKLAEPCEENRSDTI